jgi:transposase
MVGLILFGASATICKNYVMLPSGTAALVGKLSDLKPAIVVLEASGGYEIPLLAALATASIPAAAVNPRQVRDFARAVGKLAKPVLYVNIGISGTTKEEVVVLRDAGL